MIIKKGYYGDIFGVMFVCDLVGGMYYIFEKVLFKYIFIECFLFWYGEGLNKEDEVNFEKVFKEYY